MYIIKNILKFRYQYFSRHISQNVFSHDNVMNFIVFKWKLTSFGVKLRCSGE